MKMKICSAGSLIFPFSSHCFLIIKSCSLKNNCNGETFLSFCEGKLLAALFIGLITVVISCSPDIFSYGFRYSLSRYESVLLESLFLDRDFSLTGGVSQFTGHGSSLTEVPGGF